MKSRAIERELIKIKKKEDQILKKATNKDNPLWKAKLEEKIPDKVIIGLEKMFCKAFSLINEKSKI